MQIRKYRPSDCRELAELFYDTVHTVNAGDYTKEQLDAWATGHVDLEAWDRSFREHHTLVALEDGAVIGFGPFVRPPAPSGQGRGNRPLRQAGAGVRGRYQHPRIDYGEAFF